MPKKKAKKKKTVTPKSVSEPPKKETKPILADRPMGDGYGDETKSVLSETPVIGGEQVNAPPRVGAIPAIKDMPVIPRPAIAKEPPIPVPTVPVICMGCKGTYDLDIMRICHKCKGTLAYCPACAEAGTCHRCGKEL